MAATILFTTILSATIAAAGDAYDAGVRTSRLVGSLLVLLWILGCWRGLRRPGTSRMCSLSLIITLLAVLTLQIASLISKSLGPSRTVGLMIGAVTLVFVTAGAVVAIIGLVDYRAQGRNHQRGRAAAVTALIISALLVSVMVGGALKAARRTSAASLVSKDKGVAGSELSFEELNFKITTPGRPWVRMDAAKVNPEAAVAFMRSRPHVFFMVLAESAGFESGYDTGTLAEVAKANLGSVATQYRVLSERPVRSGGLPWTEIESEVRLAGHDFHYINRVMATNGFLFQLVTWGSLSDRVAVAREAEVMGRAFALLDPDRVSVIPMNPAPRQFTSKRFGYQVELEGDSWELWDGEDIEMPEAEYVVSGFGQRRWLFVVPLYLFDCNPSLDAISVALLKTMLIELSDPGLSDEVDTEAEGWVRRGWTYRRELEGVDYLYRLEVCRRGNLALLVAAYEAEATVPDLEALDAAIRQVTLPADPPAILDASTLSDNARYAHANAFNAAALTYFEAQQYDDALCLFALGVDLKPRDDTLLGNLLLCLTRLDRCDEALEWIERRKERVDASQSLTAWKAFLLARNERPEEALEVYANLFQAGYRADSDLKDYLELLVDQGQSAKALAVCESYLEAGDSLDIRIKQAELLSLRGLASEAIELLQEQLPKHPRSANLHYRLAEALLDADRNSEALELCRDMESKGLDSGYTAYLRGKTQYGLKWYREAKASFEVAVAKMPQSESARSFLEHVSGLLGEGSNSAIKQRIPPVALPEDLLPKAGDLAEPVGEGFGAAYIWRGEALRYVKDEEFRSTEYLWARVLDRSGLERLSTIDKDFDPLHEEVYVNKLVVRNESGKEVATGKVEDYYVLDDTASGMASQDKVLHIPVPGLRVGYTVECQVTRRQLAVPSEMPFKQVIFSRTLPVAKAVVSVEGDVDEISHRTSGSVEVTRADGRLVFLVNKPEVWRQEPLGASDLSHLPTLWLGDGGSDWTDIAKDYLEGIKDCFEEEGAATRAAKECVGDDGTPGAEKVLRLASFVQKELTYKAIEFGRRGRHPAKAGRTLARKYGDCKDHALLLQRLCAATGVKARLALVNTAGKIVRDIPSLDQFNHMILYLPETEGGRFLDGTLKHHDPSLPVPFHLAGRWALVLDADQPRFVRIADYPDGASGIDCERRSRLVNEHDLEIEEVQTFSGYYAGSVREWLSAIPAAERVRAFQRQLGTVEPGVEVVEFSVESLDDTSQPLVVKFSCLLRDQFKPEGTQLLGRLPVIWERYALGASPVEQRTTPFELGPPLSVHTRTRFSLPEDRVISTVTPFSHQEQHPDFKAESNARITDGELVLEFQCRRGSGIRPAAGYRAYQQAAAGALRAIEQSFSLRQASQ